MARIRKRIERNNSYPGCWFYETEDEKDKIYYCKYRDENGKQVTAKCGQWSRGYTLKKCSEKLADLKRGVAKTNQQLRREAEQKKKFNIEYLYEFYLEVNEGKGRDDSRFYRWILPYWKKIIITETTNEDVSNFEKSLNQQVSASGKPLSTQSIKHCLALFRRIIRKAEEKGEIKTQISNFSIPEVDNMTTEDLTSEQLKSLLHVLQTDKVNRHVCDMLLLILNTGMRRGEVLKLQWQYVNFERKTITLKDTKGAKLNQGKGSNDVIIFMNQTAKKILKRQKKSSTFVFPGKNGCKRRHIDKQAKRIRDLAGLPKSFRPCHGLRHFFGTELADRGEKIELISKMLGHKSLGTTMRYVNVRDERKQQAVEKLNFGG